VWDVLRCTANTIGAIANEQGRHTEEDQYKRRMMVEVSLLAPNPYQGPQYQPGPPGKAYTRIDSNMVYSTLYQQSNKKAPGRDSIGIPIIKALLV
jgi:hypothetical protein